MRATASKSILCPSAAASRPLRSFPTRRSSDLTSRAPGLHVSIVPRSLLDKREAAAERRFPALEPEWEGAEPHPRRSEEHTSELQSRFELVCRLLLEKKK